MIITILALLAVLFWMLPLYSAAVPITFPPGAYNFNDLPINDKVKSVGAVIDRSLWIDPVITAKAKVTISNDSKWSCGYSSRGTVTPTKTNKTVVYCPVPPGANRKVSVNLIVAGGTLKVKVSPSISTKE